MAPAKPIQFSHRRLMRRVAQAALPALCFAFMLALRGDAQSSPGTGAHSPFGQPVGPASGPGVDDGPNGDPIEAGKRLKALNAERQKSMVSDANKLLMLMDELNSEIARSNPDSLTPAQLRTLSEIEKLAHNVRDKMGTSFVGAPQYRQPLLPRR